MSDIAEYPFEQLHTPSLKDKGARIFDNSLTPFKRMQTMSPSEFEDLTAAWLLHTRNYKNVCTLGGSKDAGRDVVAYYTSPTGKIDIYQCKHYSKPLTPSVFCVEFGKLCYYTWIEKYRIPEKYYVVGSNGIGDDLRTYIEKPDTINDYVIRNWDKYCGPKNKICREGIKLENSLRQYIEEFDFSIVDEISPQTLISEMESSKLFKYFFGGGLAKRPCVPKPPEHLDTNELTFPYIQQLFQVYEDCVAHPIKKVADILDATYVKHLQQQRHCYYSAQCLARFARDELLDNDAYLQIQTEVEYAIDYTARRSHGSRFDRVEEVLATARNAPINNDYLQPNTLDKCGICHELVNEGGLKWYE